MIRKSMFAAMFVAMFAAMFAVMFLGCLDTKKVRKNPRAHDCRCLIWSHFISFHFILFSLYRV